MRRIAALLVVLAVGLVGCRLLPINPAAAAPPPLSPGAGANFLSDEAIQSARTLYIAKCARCHKFRDPAKYTDDKWNSWMTKMSRKAKLKPDQEIVLREYLGLFRVSQKPSPN